MTEKLEIFMSWQSTAGCSLIGHRAATHVARLCDAELAKVVLVPFITGAILSTTSGFTPASPLLIEDSKQCSPHSKQKFLLYGQEDLQQETSVYFNWYCMEGKLCSHAVSASPSNSIH